MRRMALVKWKIARRWDKMLRKKNVKKITARPDNNKNNNNIEKATKTSTGWHRKGSFDLVLPRNYHVKVFYFVLNYLFSSWPSISCRLLPTLLFPPRLFVVVVWFPEPFVCMYACCPQEKASVQAKWLHFHTIFILKFMLFSAISGECSG